MDEPLYGFHLHSNPHLSRPYKDALFASQPYAAGGATANLQVLTDSSLYPDSEIVFFKHMGKHFPLLNISADDASSLGSQLLRPKPHQTAVVHKHIILIRDPLKVISSWSSAVSSGSAQSCTLGEIGLPDLLSAHSVLSSSSTAWGSNVAVLDSDRLLSDPAGTLGRLCEELGILYDPAMLKWSKGPKPYDGCWASHWYASVWESTCFSRPKSSTPKPFPSSLLPLYRSCLPFFEVLKAAGKEGGNRTTFAGDKVPYEDPRNEHVFCYVGLPGGKGGVVPRDQARISPFDSSVQGGDAVWEGVRVYRGKVFKLERHIKRLLMSAKALDFKNVHEKEEIVDAVFQTLAVNGMRDGAHIRLTLSRGIKYTSSMNPKFNVFGTTLIVLAEWKATEGATTYDNSKGVKLITASGRRNNAACVDSKIHHNNLINNILPKIQANNAGAADALMLDQEGFVSETNACNVFMVADGKVYTPTGDSCLPGITRESIILLCGEMGIPCFEKRISLVEFMTADEAFTTGTMGELTPIVDIDGRIIGDGKPGEITKRLTAVYKTCPEREGWATPLPDF